MGKESTNGMMGQYIKDSMITVSSKDSVNTGRPISFISTKVIGSTDYNTAAAKPLTKTPKSRENGKKAI